jgi:hypothetical protein
MISGLRVRVEESYVDSIRYLGSYVLLTVFSLTPYKYKKGIKTVPTLSRGAVNRVKINISLQAIPNTMADPRPLPTPVSILIGTAIIAGISGYMIGVASSLGFLPIPFRPKASVKRGIENYDDEEESAEEEIDEAVIINHAPNWANGYEADTRDGLRVRRTEAAAQPEPAKSPASRSSQDGNEECKLVLVVRTDLGMTKGPHLPPPFPSTP